MPAISIQLRFAGFGFLFLIYFRKWRGTPSHRWCEEGDYAGEQEELSSVTSGTLHSGPPTQVRLCVIMMILLLLMMMAIWWPYDDDDGMEDDDYLACERTLPPSILTRLRTAPNIFLRACVQLWFQPLLQSLLLLIPTVRGTISQCRMGTVTQILLCTIHVTNRSWNQHVPTPLCKVSICKFFSQPKRRCLGQFSATLKWKHECTK